MLPLLVANLARRQLLQGLGGLFVLPLVGACFREPPLAVASHVWPGYELMFLAREEGWLDEAPIRFLETRSATESLAALKEGRVQAAALTLDEVLRGRADGLPLTIILVFDISAGADVVLSRPDIQTPAQLKGRRIGVETSALGALMLARTLAYAGLSKADVTVVPVTPDQHIEAWQAGKVDTLITYEPIASKLLRSGAHHLLDSRAFPETIFDVLAVRSDAAVNHKKALKMLVAGHFRGLEHLLRNPQDAAYRLAERLGLPGDQALNAFRGLSLPALSENRYLLDGHGSLQVAAKEITQLLRADGLLDKTDDLNGLVSNAYLPPPSE